MNIKKKLKQRIKYNYFTKDHWWVHKFICNTRFIDLSKCFCKGGHPWVLVGEEYE